MGSARKKASEFEKIPEWQRKDSFSDKIPVWQTYDKTGERIPFDPDSSPEAWKHFERCYTGKHWPLIKKFDLKNKEDPKGDRGSDGKVYYRLLPKAKMPEFAKSCKNCSAKDQGDCNHFKLGGETDFNFNKIKRPKFERLISDDKWGQCLLCMCVKMHQTLLNFSIMASHGSLQKLKQDLKVDDSGRLSYAGWSHGYDRLDTFVYCLSQYFEFNNDFILSKSGLNSDCLKNYLDTFKKNDKKMSIYNYCEKIYFIKDKKFVRNLIKSGKDNKLETAENAIEYMKLALEYWRIRKEEFDKIYNEKYNT